MLDPTKRLILKEFPAVQIYQDHEDQEVHYVVPWTPLLATENNGRPSLRLLIYLKREGDKKLPSGGQLTLTTTLELTPQDLARIKRAIAGYLKEQETIPGTLSVRPMTLRVASPEWLSGKVEVRVIDSLVLNGQPSLYGGNQCALMSALNAGQARAIRNEWDRQLPHGRIIYQMVMRIAAKDVAMREVTRHQTVCHPHGGLTEVVRATTIDVHAVTATTMPITIEGPLWRDGLDQQIVELDIT